jgi:putative ABC transport system ATP-binding protein
MDEVLVMQGVSKAYWRGQRSLAVLADVSLTVRAGEVVAVVGSRDEGKTTLLKLAAAMETPDEGRIQVVGHDLGMRSSHERERLLGAEVAWIDRERPGVRWKACDYVALPLAMGRGSGRREARAKARAALERVGAEGCAEQRWGDLSNWERMLVGLARAFAGSPRLVLIDDLLDGFGTFRTQESCDLLRSLVEEHGCGVLMSASGLEATLFADTVLSLGHAQLKRMVGGVEEGGQLTEAEVIDFPGTAHDSGSRHVGS